MDIVNAASARADFYDRNALVVILSYNASNIVPHGVTVRDTYTVPAGKKSIVNGLSGEIIRRLVATGSGATRGYYSFTPDGGLTDRIFSVEHLALTIYTDGRNSVSPAFVMYPGDQIDLVTTDAKGTGSANYSFNGMITEFDY